MRTSDRRSRNGRDRGEKPEKKSTFAYGLALTSACIVFALITLGAFGAAGGVVTDFLLELKRMGKSILLSTHIFSLVEKLCDRVGIIIDGRMVRDGTLEGVCGGMTLEDRFFEIYREVKGETV